MINLAKSKKLPLIITLLALNVTSCSTSKTVLKKITDNFVSSSPQQSGPTLLINGDSDSQTAGKLQTILFATNRHRATGTNLVLLRKNLSYLKGNPEIEVELEGHADERGSRYFNVKLARKRARWIKQYLAIKGIVKGRLSSTSFGEEKPIDFTHAEEGWSKNRRVNFVVVEKSSN
ncbi:MAG: OmpA family protein [Bdellovibrionales bacterium]|jgi:peptidoglycan-associated lipoprotein|nr:OmpA family protein [Bdellovibrionales bacterium]MBT3527020.1 OmpA family protein [Bdellovibrionales bacterium]MBT7668016.1 OmpA family protein [Bdellovibrionales bacterium]MBT7766495.1 OmpA family protein [Bdellovibrionales bacterium]